MLLRVRILLAVAFAAIAGLVVLATPAGAVDTAGAPAPGAACVGQVGETTVIDTRAGRQTYRCERRDGDPCPVWHWMFDAGVPKGQLTPTRCPGCPGPVSSSAAPSVIPSVTPSAAPSSSVPAAPAGVPSSLPAAELPRTDGPPLWYLLFAAAACGVAGGLFVLLGRRPRIDRSRPKTTTR